MALHIRGRASTRPYIACTYGRRNASSRGVSRSCRGDWKVARLIRLEETITPDKKKCTFTKTK
ncbi:MAG: hypothetical protein K2G49_03495 [Muribaculum sp.]|nr:hypothetical protein [Muribaculum sp.]